MSVNASRPLHSTWDAVLAAADRLTPSDIVCFGSLPADGPDGCLVVNGDDLPPDLDVPPEAVALGYESCLSSGQIQEVIENARLQIANPDRPTLYRAIGYYFVNDAFIDLRHGQQL
jgi:hypothetical protein